jgi:hypothetical protein
VAGASAECFFSPLGIIPSERVSGSKNIQRIQAEGRSCSLTLAVTSDLLATVKLDLSCMLNLSATPRRPDLSLAGHGLFNRETSAIAPRTDIVGQSDHFRKVPKAEVSLILSPRHPKASTWQPWSIGSPACRNPSADLEYAQETVRNIGVIVGEEPCCIEPMTLKPWRS